MVMENFTPRVMDGWGLGYDDLRLVKPDIVMVSLSGFGHSGPWRNYAALGATVQALSGLTHLTAYDESHPDGIGFAYADHVSGLYAALAALAALRAEAARARARWREACLLDCKHQFMRLAGSFEAWRASALARRALAEREAQLQEARWGRCAGALPCVGAGCAAGFLAASDAEALSSRLATAPAHTRPLA